MKFQISSAALNKLTDASNAVSNLEAEFAAWNQNPDDTERLRTVLSSIVKGLTATTKGAQSLDGQVRYVLEDISAALTRATKH